MLEFIIHSLHDQLDQLNIKPQCAEKYLTISLNLDAADFDIASLSDKVFCSDLSDNYFYSRQPDNTIRLGFGELLSLNTSGENRFNWLRSEIKKLRESWLTSTDGAAYASGFMAIAFDQNDSMENIWQGFSNSQFVIPKIVLEKKSEKTQLRVSLPISDVRGTDEPLACVLPLLKQIFSVSNYYENSLEQKFHIENLNAEQQWKKNSQQAISEIKKGNFGKLVLSRMQVIHCDADISILSLVKKLQKYYPTCSIHCHKISGKTLVSASPERIASLVNNELQCDAIGGTIETEARQQFNYSENSKLQEEHGYISQDIYQRLDKLCHSLAMPTSPLLMKLRNLYHLETPIRGVLDSQYDIFDVLKALHPTPAVAGFPAAKAKQWLIENESYQRGWYTGVCGWLDEHLNGELSVILRCALIQKNKMQVFAGAGLVAESDWQLEWQETELKMQTLLELI